MDGSAGIWQAVLGELELTVSRGHYVTWFKNTHLLEYTPENAIIGVPNVFIKQQMERRYVDLLGDLLEKNGLRPKTITFEIYTSPDMKKGRATNDDIVVLDAAAQQNKPRKSTPNTTTSGVAHKYRQGLNSKYTFDNFIVGSSNELAYAACQSIAQTPGDKYNPLFLYGGVGIGKTHLIQAVGNAILGSNPSRISYIYRLSSSCRSFLTPSATRKTRTLLDTTAAQMC